MSKIFNKYGNVIENPTLDEYDVTIADTAKDYMEHAQDLGATIVELRALEAHLMSVVSNAFAENRLRTQINLKKKERNRHKFVYHFHCLVCDREWDIKLSEKPSNNIAGHCCEGAVVGIEKGS